MKEQVAYAGTPEGAVLLARLLKDYKLGRLGGSGSGPLPSPDPKSAIPTYIVKTTQDASPPEGGSETEGGTTTTVTGTIHKIEDGELVDQGVEISCVNVTADTMPAGFYSAARDPFSGLYVLAGGVSEPTYRIEVTTGKIKQRSYPNSESGAFNYVIDRLALSAQNDWATHDPDTGEKFLCEEVVASNIFLSGGGLANNTTVAIRRAWLGNPDDWDEEERGGPIPHVILLADVCGMEYEEPEA